MRILKIEIKYKPKIKNDQMHYSIIKINCIIKYFIHNYTEIIQINNVSFFYFGVKYSLPEERQSLEQNWSL